MFESVSILSKDYPLNQLFDVLDINKSSYYYWLNIKPIKDKRTIMIFNLIIHIYSESGGIYGSPKITAILNNQYGIIISQVTVSRYMVILGIRSIVSKAFKQKYSTMTKDERLFIINLIKDLDITHINQVWTTDITYIHTINDGTFYLISFIDLFSKKVVAWDLCNDQKTDKIINVLSFAIKSRNPNPGLIIHSDKGSQMRSKDYRKFLHKHNFVFSYTSLNHSCDENAAQESFHASLKKEAIYQHKLYTREDAYRVIFDYIEGFYNPIRVHSSIGYLSPVNFENSLFSSSYPL